MKNKLFLIITIILPFILVAGEVNDIRGYISDVGTGESLPYANVVIPSLNIGVASNSEGYFVLPNIPIGICTLKVSYIGFHTKEYIFVNEIQKSQLIRIKLKSTSINMNSVEVVANKYEIMDATSGDVSQITLSTKELKFLPSLGETDIFHSLKLLPGISNVGDGKGGLYIRGGTPNQNMTILDGMTLYHVDHFFGMFSAFNSDAVKDVQVYKGGYPAKFGGRLSSVVELTGKKGGDEKRFDFGANLLSANILYSTPLFNDKANFLISGRRSYTDLIKTPFYESMFKYVTGEEAISKSSSTSMKPGGGGRGGMMQEDVGPNFYYYDVNSKFSYNPTDRDFLTFSLYSGHDNLDESSEMEREGGFKTGGNTSFSSLSNAKTTEWGNIAGSLKWGHQWGNRLFTNLMISNSNFNSSFNQDLSFNGANTVASDSSNTKIGGFAQDEINRVSDWSLNFDNHWQFNQNHLIDFGIFYSDIHTDYEATSRDTIQVLKVNSNSVTLAGYIQDKWKLNPLLNITWGVRSSYYDQTNKLYIAPRLSFDYKLTEHLKLKGAWGKYYQFINSINNENVLQGSDKFWLTANEDLKPSSSYHYISGLSYSNKSYLFEVQAYYKTMNDLIEFSRRYHKGADYNDYFFFGDGVARGVEFLAQKKFGKFTGWLSYTLANVDYTFQGFNNGEAYPASQDRTHEFKSVGTYKWKDWTFSTTWVYTTGSPTTIPESQYFLTMLDGSEFSYFHVGDKNSYRLPDYHRMDISIGKQFETENYFWDVGLSIYNLYNHKNISYREYNLDVTPIVVSDVNFLGFTPSIFFKLHLK